MSATATDRVHARTTTATGQGSRRHTTRRSSSPSLRVGPRAVLRPPDRLHVRLVAQAGPADLRRPRTPGGRSCPSATSRSTTTPACSTACRSARFLAQLDRHLRRHGRARHPHQQHGRVRPVAAAVARARASSSRLIIATLIVPFETLALPLLWWVNKLPSLEADGFQPRVDAGLARHLPGADHPVHRQRVLDLPLLPVLLLASRGSSTRPPAWTAPAGSAIYRRIVMPLSGPAIATVAILTFLPAWNSYLWPLMVVQSEELRPVMVGLQYFFQLNVVLGPGHGVLVADHHPRPRAVPRVPALLHQLASHPQG